MTANIVLSFTDLPSLVQEKILRSFSYAELSRLRSISKHFHRLCSEQLNRGYLQLEVIIHDLQRQIKAKLPRRESERHKHPLSTKFDIISSLDSRIQWLKLTFGSVIQNSLCCFYPGRLLDEIYSVLNQLKTQQSFSNPCTILQETRDMSSMAIEHFREQIKPRLQSIRFTTLTTIRNNLSTLSTTMTSSLSNCHKKQTDKMLRRRIYVLKNRIYKQNLILKSQNSQMKHYKELLHMRTKSIINHHRRLKYLEKKSKQSEQMLLEMRKENDALLQRIDQFILTYNSMPIEIRKKCDEVKPQRHADSKRRKIN